VFNGDWASIFTGPAGGTGPKGFRMDDITNQGFFSTGGAGPINVSFLFAQVAEQ